MSLPVEVLRALLERGVDSEAILAAAEAAESHAKAQAAAVKAEAEAREEERLARRRQSNRERQARYYARHFCDNADNAVIVRDNASNGVMRREAREDAGAKGPQTPKNPPEDINPPLPSEATAPLPAKPRRFDWPADYREQFWAAYPRHTDRKKAMLSLNRVRRADRVAFEDILAGCARLQAADIEPAFLPHATTWLNNERWTDEIPGRSSPKARGSPGGQRLSGPTAAILARKQNRDSPDEPALNLEPVLRPFPSRRSPEAAAPPERDDSEAEGNPGRPFEGRVVSVFDPGIRRAHG